MKNELVSKIAICLALLIFAVVSFLPLATELSRPERYTEYVASLDEKTETVLKLTAASTLASAGISAIPGDTATPIAEKLADFSEYFLLILCVLYAEKFLLTLLPLGVCRVLIPLACVLFCVGRLKSPRALDRLGWKTLLVSALLLLLIPLSIRMSDLVYTSYQSTINAAIDSAEELSEDTSALAEAQEDTGLLNIILNRISETAASLNARASAILNRFIETLAVMIVSACLIPVLVLLFFLWIIKLISGIDPRDYIPRRPRAQ